MNRFAAWVLILWATTAAAQSICVQPSCTAMFPGGLQLPDIAFTPAAPASGNELIYGKQGAGLCARDGTNTERCTGGGGGGGTPGGVNGNVQINNAGAFGPYGGTACANKSITSLDLNGAATCTPTVTNVAALLTNNQLVFGNTYPDVKAAATTGCGGSSSSTANCGVLDNSGNLTISTVKTEDQNTAGLNSFSLFGNGAGVAGLSCAAAGHAKQLTILDQSAQNVDGSRFWTICNGTTSTGMAIQPTGFTLNNAAPTQSAVQGNSGTILDVNTTGVTSGHCLQFDANLNAQDSGAACGGGGTPSFSGITSGTNTTAAMLVGTGASLGPSGSGTINATSMAFGGLTTGTNTTGTLTIGTGATLGTSGSGTINATGVPWTGITGSGTTTNTNGSIMQVGAGTTLRPVSSSVGVVQANQLSVPCTNCVQLGGANSDVTGTLLSPNIGSPLHVDSVAGIDCTGASDSTAGWNTLMTSLSTTPTSIWIPSKCRITFDSPGAGNAVSTIPSNLLIHCEDQTAGWQVNARRCVGGTYGVNGSNPGAACTTSAECLGGGTCTFIDALHPTLFATTANSTYTLFKDVGATANAQNIQIENCSVWTYQSEPYQRCTGGTNANDPCRQECNAASTNPGARCDTNAECPSGACLNLNDCMGTAGGTACQGTPLSASGPGWINVFDFRNTHGVVFDNVSVYDHLNQAGNPAGTFTLMTGPGAIIQKSNFAREITDCTSPQTFPTGSQCIDGSCCYGAHYNGSSAHTNNFQPANGVPTGVQTGTDSQIQFTRARGSTNAVIASDRSRIDESSVLPSLNSAGVNIGPGGPGGGFQVGSLSIVAKSYVLSYAGTGTAAVYLNGNDSSAIEDRVQAVAGLSNSWDGIKLSGNDDHAIADNVKGITGSNPANSYNGIEADGVYDEVRGNYLEGTTNGVGILVTGVSGNATLAGNQINSNPVNTLSEGIHLNAFIGPNHIIDNIITQPLVDSIHLSSGAGVAEIVSNVSILAQLSNAPSAGGQVQLTQTLKPIHVLTDNASSQNRIVANGFQGGWRGIVGGTGSNGGLFNTNITANRFVQLLGADLSVGGAGIKFQGNYSNTSVLTGIGTTTPWWSLSCDPSCGGGGTPTRGTLCQQDSDCTAGGNTCNASANKCVPDPIIFAGNPQLVGTITGHLLVADNVLFWANTVKQCGGANATNPGAFCNTTGAAGACAGGGTCTGGSGVTSTCVGGTEAGAVCCLGTPTITCLVRSPGARIRYPDWAVLETGTSNSDTVIVGNDFLGSSAELNTVDIDMFNTSSGSNLEFLNSTIAANHFTTQSTPGTNVGIRFPTAFNSVTGVNIAQNSFDGYTNSQSAIQNYQGAFGSISLQNGHPAVGTQPNLVSATTVAAPGDFFPVTGFGPATPQAATESNAQEVMAGTAGTVWKMTCDLTTAGAVTGNDTRTVVLRKNGVSQAMTCQFAAGATATQCTTAAGSASAPITFAGGDTLDWAVSSSHGTGTSPATNISCVMYISHDTAL